MSVYRVFIDDGRLRLGAKTRESRPVSTKYSQAHMRGNGLLLGILDVLLLSEYVTTLGNISTSIVLSVPFQLTSSS